MIICATSDTHGELPRIPPCDLFIHAGDFNHRSEIIEQMVYMNGPFLEWFEKIPAKKKVLVPGNHDFIFEEAPHLLHKKIMDCTLIDQSTTFENLHIFGTPWTPWFLDWSYNSPKEEPRKTEFLTHKCDIIPINTNILVCHGPPCGILDITSKGELVGNVPLRNWIDKNQPEIAIFGHIHNSRGQLQLGRTRCFNVSYLSENYTPSPLPYGSVFLIDTEEKPEDIPF